MTTSAFARRLLLPLVIGLPALAGNASPAEKDAARIQLKPDDAQGRLLILIDGVERAVYRYGTVDLPHFFPLNSPSGKSLTIDRTDPFPHHRALWFADTVVLEGRRQASFYNALYSQVDRKDPQSPFRDHIRHVEFSSQKAAGKQAEYGERLLWEMDQNVPVLDETRQVRMVAFDQGEFLLDLSFTLTAAYGDVKFTSDGAHYAWPYVRMHPQFSVAKGGTITNSEGGVNQKGTNNQRARWVDYSNTIDGVTEGLAFFTHDQDEPAHLWLTRDYGTFGVRRADAQNGKPFTVKKGESLPQRVGILIHRGDVKAGQVAERYRQYLEGKRS
jgi:hypothetical protein